MDGDARPDMRAGLHRYPRAHRRCYGSEAVMETFKPIFLVNAAMALAFGIFYAAFILCGDLGASPYVGALVCFALYAALGWREYRLFRAAWPRVRTVRRS